MTRRTKFDRKHWSQFYPRFYVTSYRFYKISLIIPITNLYTKVWLQLHDKNRNIMQFLWEKTNKKQLNVIIWYEIIKFKLTLWSNSYKGLRSKLGKLQYFQVLCKKQLWTRTETNSTNSAQNNKVWEFAFFNQSHVNQNFYNFSYLSLFKICTAWPLFELMV